MLLDISKSFESLQMRGASKKQIGRIADAYNYSVAAQKNSPACYQVSREWLPIYTGYLQKVMHALSIKDVDSLTQMYENLFRESLSTGLHGLHFEMVEKYMQPEQPIAPDDLNALMDLFKLYARQFLLSNPSKSLDLLRRPPVGNPYGYNLDGTTIYVGAEYHYHYSTAIQRMLKHEAKPVVFELGGGFGGMAYYLLRDTKNITYIAADLPENAALQAYYLISHFPDKRIALFGEFDAASFDQEEYDAVIIPNFCIEKLKTDIAHLSFNSYSLAEMDLQSVNNYIHHICRISSRFFYHLNHVVWPVNSDDFPIDYQKFELHSRHPVMWGRDILNCKLDHHEYVYTRK